MLGLTAVSAGILASSIDQFKTGLLCREYLNRLGPTNTAVLAAAEIPSSLFNAATEKTIRGMIKATPTLRPGPECQAPEIQAFTAKTLAVIHAIKGIASTLSIGYWTSLSDKHGRVKIMLVSSVNALFMLGCLVTMGMWWNQIGLPLMVIASLVNGLLGGVGLGGALILAYAADCTDPSRRSLIYSWLHAGISLGFSMGPFLGGTLVKATGSIMVVIYFNIVAGLVALVMLVFVLPESLPSKQPALIRNLYEKATKSCNNDPKMLQEQHVAWHSHVVRSLLFFKPNGRNTNLILLAAISFLQTLALQGTFSVLILYTNRCFLWTEYEDGILLSLSSTIRVLSLLIILPGLVHFYHRQAVSRQIKHGKMTDSSDYITKETNDPSNCHSQQQQHRNESDRNEEPVHTYPYHVTHGLEDPVSASNLEHLRDAALDISDDECSFQERSHRQSTFDYATTLAPPAPSSLSLPSASRTNYSAAKAATSSTSPSSSSTPSSSTDSSSAPGSSKKTANDTRLDTWIVRLGFAINSATYIGFGISTQAWMFYMWYSLHAISIIAAPSLKSLLTSLVRPSQFGAVFGAIVVLESIAGIFSHLAISWVYASTVKTRPDFVWYYCAVLTGLAMVLSFMIRQKLCAKGVAEV
ncbi:hypothetical protein BGZ68_006853 [Mortierella alpina]|nr:hypothetical protein BGZ68_006853 [Mortierella alpina]